MKVISEPNRVNGKHQVDVGEMLLWIEREMDGAITYASASGYGRPMKRLKLKLSGGFIVMNGLETVYNGSDAQEAANWYNAI